MRTDSKKLVFLDIDGTLIAKGRQMTEKTVQALRQANDNGHILCICTGRTYYEMPEEMKRFDGIISAAGACVMWKKKVLLAEFFSEEEKRQMEELFEEAGAIYAMEAFEDLYMREQIYRDFAARLDGRGEEERAVLDLFKKAHFYTETEKAQKVHKCSYFYAEKDTGWFREKLKKWNMSVAVFSQSETRGNSGEITKAAFTKGTAVRYLSDFLRIPIENTIGIGDSENDLEMLRAAGVGIAMGNSFDCVKEAADDVTASVEEEGVYQAFQKYGLI